jgi:hypothetical protein
VVDDAAVDDGLALAPQPVRRTTAPRRLPTQSAIRSRICVIIPCVTRVSIRFALLAVVATALLVGACGSAARPVTAPPTAVQTPSRVAITVHDSGPGTRLSPGFIGLGLEANTLAGDEFARTNLADYMRRLDPHGLLRIGGNSVESFWTSTGQPAPGWSHGRITPADLRALADTIRGTGWRVILGLAFKHSDPARAADEATYAHQILGPALAAIEIGNEPNHYGITEAVYFAGFERFLRAIKRAVPGIPIAGPATGREAPTWMSTFARDEAPHPDIALFTSHEYPLSICSGQHPTIAELLSTTSEGHEVAAADSTVAAAHSLGVPAVMDETNSVVCWGAPGVSNTYASALWILDYGLLLAQHGIAAANFQTRISGCTPYLPVCTRAHSTRLFARPEFYGLLALGQVGTGRFLKVTNPASVSLRAYAVQTGPRRLSVVLDDLGGAKTVTLQLPDAHDRRARQTVLLTRSPHGLAATAQISLGDRSVSANAQVATPVYTPLTVSGSAVTVSLRAHTAVIIKLG